MLTFQCINCNIVFQRQKKDCHKMDLKNPKPYCSRKCHIAHQKANIPIQTCGQCAKEFRTTRTAIRGSKSGLVFCSSSCAATYNNTHKTKGTRRSKLEIFLEQKLTPLYSNLEILFNDKSAINSELDIYIPSLKLAFELNGIFHYEPIYGKEKLAQIQNNDSRKFQACLECGIELCIIDTSYIKVFNEKKAQDILSIVANIINQKIN